MQQHISSNIFYNSKSLTGKLISVLFISLFSFLVFIPFTSGQSVTSVSGRIYDADTKEPLIFVEVSFLGTTVGTTTDTDGYFLLETRFPSDTLMVNYLGYVSQKVKVVRGKKQNFDFYLKFESKVMETVVFKAKKEKYSKKNNPALELAKKVTQNRKQNHLKGLDYLQYEKYEKVRLDLNNITHNFKNSFITKDLEFMWEFEDTSSINGKTYLPIFLRETLSTYYFRKSPEKEKEYRKAIKFSEITEQFDAKSLNSVIDVLYTDIDIYNDEIQLLENQFVSPVSKPGFNFYRYYIIDTTIINGKSAINLAFIPAVKGNIGFTGNMYISNDEKYTVLKIDMGIINGINLNFVRDLRIEQEFEPYEDKYIRTKDVLTIDYSLSANGLGAFGTRTVVYSDFKFNEPSEPSVYSGLLAVEEAPDVYRPNEFWEQNRLVPLNKSDSDLYKMVDMLRSSKKFNSLVYLTRVFTTGFVPLDRVEFGPLATFASYNPVEGTQIRFGGWSTFKLSKKILLQAYGSYTTRMKRYKYSTGFTYTFNEDYKRNPRHYIRLSADRESIFPGQDLDFFSPDNILLSLRRGVVDKMLFNDVYKIFYENENDVLSYNIALIHKNREPIGTLQFLYNDPVLETEVSIQDITTSEVQIGLKFAPNEKFIQGKQNRRPLFNEYPVIKLNYIKGFENILGGQYNYDRLTLNLFKQFEWTTWGTTNIILESGKIWGDVPYILKFIPRGNQTYAYQLASYNLMNFLEFSTDQYASINIEHFFFGRFLNQVPLIKKLKLREVVTFKALYGSTSAKNNPNLHSELVQLPKDENGQTTTFLLDGRPYIEASIGVTNIFKMFRVDLVRRFNYLENPNLPTLFGSKGWGIRARIHLEF
ncbi:MAG: carboxypeptidase-like regulatory domain-containing protein [Saprospiraceae bacterium]|nr:carboxypeptidase-like regulatory domain-containing protein [Saprospiraceae bacterium]